jgi:Hemolysin coregulated protein Hcp (TssD)
MPISTVTAVATIDGHKYEISEFSYGFYQKTDKRGSPTDGVRGHLIQMMVHLTENAEVKILYDWAFKTDRQLSGYVEFTRNDGGNTVQKVEFKDAYCVALSDKFQPSNSTVRAIEAFTIPNTENFLPSIRGHTFGRMNATGKGFDLIISASKIKIGQIEVTCF